jgi:hypothetical protein
MSLIVQINPVPWKILDLVKARILKNRAKKAKKGIDWSKETLRREMRLQPVSLLSRKREEPSFAGLARVLTFTIEGKRTVLGAENTVDEWKVYYQDEQQKGTTSRTLHANFFVPTGNPNFFNGAIFIDNFRNLTSKLYVSFYSDPGSGDSLTPILVVISSATVDAYTVNDPTTPYPWTLAVAQLKAAYNFADEQPEEGIIRLNEIFQNDDYNPLRNWPDPKTLEGASFYNGVNGSRPPAAPQTALPLETEFDESGVAQIPGYIKTVVLELNETSNQSVSITVES